MSCRGDPACDLPFFDRDTPAEPWTAEIEVECGGERQQAVIADAAGTPAGSAELTLPAGPATLTTTLTRGDAATFGAYYVKVELLEAIA